MDSLPLLSWQFAIIQVATEKVIDPVSYKTVKFSLKSTFLDGHC